MNSCVRTADEAVMMDLLHRLEMGTVFTKFSLKKRPEKRHIEVFLETTQIRSSKQHQRYEDAINIRDIKEIRLTKNSREFEKFSADARGFETECCIVILYGNDFRLKSLSLAASTVDDSQNWIKGLQWLLKNTHSSPHSLDIERWLRKEFYALARSKYERKRIEKVFAKDVKNLLPRINLKLTTTRLRELSAEVEDARGEISFDGFRTIYQRLIFDRKLADKFHEFSPDKKTLSLCHFSKFLIMDQKDLVGENELHVRDMMISFLDTPSRAVYEPYFHMHEFLDYLFSKHNTIFNPEHLKVNMNMDEPLSRYWIASSHNTYLTGDQFYSESSCEAYARCLRMGCRCIELDCWDGQEGLPYIKHGLTLTSKIRFMDVLKTIQEHAFATSEYPIILSIEDHCSLVQQRNMAQAFKDVFGDALLTQPIDRDGTQLPSPNQLKNKIILKHKKLPEGATDENRLTMQNSLDDSSNDFDLRQALKSGILYLQDSINHDWNPHLFVLTSDKLHYTVETDIFCPSQDDDDDTISLCSSTMIDIVPPEEAHKLEPWYHASMNGSNRRDEADRLLKEYQQGDGSFLVRESDAFKGDCSLSFWWGNNVNHCRIKSKLDRGNLKYYLIDNKQFDTIYQLISYYKIYPLKSRVLEITLTYPVPQRPTYENEEWFCHVLRSQAEDMLRCIHKDGAFLVRPREDPDTFAISFRAEGMIKHCRIMQEGRLFTIGSAQFESLSEVINYYRKHPLFRKIKLRYPINERTSIGEKREEDSLSDCAGSIYTEPNALLVRTTVIAIHDYKGQQEDEFSLCRGMVITNVEKHNNDWWKGDVGARKQMWFPANYVEEINTANENGIKVESQSPFGSLQKGALDVHGCAVRKTDEVVSGKFLFEVMASGQRSPLTIAADSFPEMEDWAKTISEAAEDARNRTLTDRRMERKKGIAKELSDLIVYCRSVPFSEDNVFGKFYEMSSFPETKLEKYTQQSIKAKQLLQYNRLQLSRTYPKGQRIDSSNYEPQPAWNCGCQMVALNYQTPDKPMQLNAGRFLANGQCGYVQQPGFMMNDMFDPLDKLTLTGVNPVTLVIKILGARHLQRSGKGISSPFVEVEIVGADYDNCSYKTKVNEDNGFCPTWENAIAFVVWNPDFALIRFVVYDQDMFGDPNFLGQGTFPLPCIRAGFRSIPLKNGFNEDFELSSLLVSIELNEEKNFHDEDYLSIQKLRDQHRQVTQAVAFYENSQTELRLDDTMRAKIREKEQIQNRIYELTQQRTNRMRNQEKIANRNGTTTD